MSQLLIRVTAQMNLKNVLVKEAKHKRLLMVQFCLYKVSGKGKTIEIESRSMVVWGWELGLTAYGHKR